MISEVKGMWKELMVPVYNWLELPVADEKWADWSVMFLLGIVVIELAVFQMETVIIFTLVFGLGLPIRLGYERWKKNHDK